MKNQVEVARGQSHQVPLQHRHRCPARNDDVAVGPRADYFHGRKGHGVHLVAHKHEDLAIARRSGGVDLVSDALWDTVEAWTLNAIILINICFVMYVIVYACAQKAVR